MLSVVFFVCFMTMITLAAFAGYYHGKAEGYAEARKLLRR